MQMQSTPEIVVGVGSDTEPNVDTSLAQWSMFGEVKLTDEEFNSFLDRTAYPDRIA